MLKKLRKSKAGFTLMELIIVIVILGILALIAIPRLLGFTNQARLANDKEYAAVVARAAELYCAANDFEDGSSGGAIAITEIDETSGKGLVDDADTMQIYDGITIDIADYKATVTLTDSTSEYDDYVFPE